MAVAADHVKLVVPAAEHALLALAPGQQPLAGLLDAEVVQGVAVGEEDRHHLRKPRPLGLGPVQHARLPATRQPPRRPDRERRRARCLSSVTSRVG